MRKSTLLLAILATALGLGTVYFYREQQALAGSIAQDKEQCTRQIATLKNEHQAKIEELQGHLQQGK